MKKCWFWEKDKSRGGENKKIKKKVDDDERVFLIKVVVLLYQPRMSLASRDTYSSKLERRRW